VQGTEKQVKKRDSKRIGRTLEEIYERYNRRNFVLHDPLASLYRYDRTEDREIAALVASSLAYGNVKQIESNIGRVLEIMGNSPRSFVMGSTDRSLKSALVGVKHRWTTGEDIAWLLGESRRVIRKYGSLESCFLDGHNESEADIVPTLTRFVDELTGGTPNRLAPSPCRGSACKRWNLFLRWMVRKDRVDPGGWDGVCPSKLLVPLDTHMFRICTEMGMSGRRSADLKTVREITDRFRELSPMDPVKYDFSLTRVSMRRNEGQEGALYRLLTGEGTS
jgi:uncharacterized protein (TIGR02757 family)